MLDRLRSSLPLTALTAILALPSLAPLAGCSAAEVGEAASVSSAHEAGAVVRTSGSPFHWASVSPKAVLSPATSVPEDDALTRRLQAWSDRIAEIAITEAEAKPTVHLPPRPIVHVVPSTDLNAWAASAIVDVGATFDDRSMGATLLTPLALEPLDLEGWVVNPRPSTWPSNRAFADVWSKQTPSCDLEAVGSDRLRSRGCAQHTGGRGLLLATSQHVFLTTGLLANVDEEGAVAVLAHELGHYYRAHASALTFGHYGFWYEGTDGRQRPVPSARAEEIAKTYASVLRAARGPVDVALLHHRRMVQLLAYLALPLSTEPAVERTCGPEVKAAAASSWIVPFLLSSGDPLATADVQAFQRYERAIATCAPSLRLGASSSSDAILRSGVTSLFVSQGFATSEAELGGEATLAGALAFAGARSLRMDQDESEMVATFRRGKIGLYTAEQEADEVMLELTSRLGLPVERTFEAWLTFMRATEAARPKREASPPASSATPSTGVVSGDLDATACRALLDAGFTEVDAGGRRRDVIVTLGTLDDPHHGSCYRLYNLWREAREHRYEPTGAFTPPAEEGGDWSTLRSHARSLAP
ncbi:MAG: M48 family metalloprotease [Deltaproteobacteria bacterium]|nr:M48 family metalloprotease [Deltaproteobacteria bacterium]